MDGKVFVVYFRKELYIYFCNNNQGEKRICEFEEK